MSDSHGTWVGNVASDPELKFLDSGKAVVNFRFAVEKRFKKGDEWDSRTSWFNVAAFDTLAENIAASFTKGTRAIVSGSFEAREYTKKDSDEKGLSLDITADYAGPELKWARAEVTRNEKGGASKQTTTKRRTEPVYGDEEPFVSVGNMREIYTEGFRNMAATEPWL